VKFVETWEWIALAAGAGALVIVAALLVSMMLRRRRTSHLKDRFGPEYEHAVSTTGQRDAERRLADVEAKHEELDIRTLPAPTRDRYLDEWRQAESRFVSDPPDAVRAADRIVIRVLEERGYPVNGDVDERTAYVAADHPEVVNRYRHAHDMVREADQSTENLRKAMVDLRVVLDELLVAERTTA
jgi:uncharacterized protein (UPF0297 family)